MLSRRLFTQRMLAGGAGLIAATALSLPARADAPTIGHSDTIHIEPPHDENTPIVHDIDFSKFYPDGATYAAGPISFTIMPNGDYNFSGQIHNGKLYEATKQFLPSNSFCAIGICIGVKDSLGTVVGFTQDGKMDFGTPYTFNKSGNNKTIKENWKYFVAKHTWHGSGAAILTAPHGASGGGGGGVDAGKVVGDVVGVLGTIAAFL